MKTLGSAITAGLIPVCAVGINIAMNKNPLDVYTIILVVAMFLGSAAKDYRSRAALPPVSPTK